MFVGLGEWYERDVYYIVEHATDRRPAGSRNALCFMCNWILMAE